MIRFTFAVILTGAALAFGVTGMEAKGWIDRLPTFLYPTLILLGLTTLVIYRYLLKVSRPGQFVQLFLLLTVVKMVAFLGYNVFMVLRQRAEAQYNVLFFLAGYFIFTFIEIAFLYRHINTKSRP